MSSYEEVKQEQERQARLLAEASKTAFDSMEQHGREVEQRNHRLKNTAQQEGHFGVNAGQVAFAKHMSEGALGTLSYPDDLPGLDPLKTRERTTPLG